MAVGKAGRPSVLIGANYHVWIGNPENEAANYPAQELFGLGTGDFEERPATQNDKSFIPFWFDSDLSLLSYEKKLLPICELLRWLCVEKGLSVCGLEDHEVTQKTQKASWFEGEGLRNLVR